MLREVRTRINLLLKQVGRSNETYKLWMGESGWSYPMSRTTQPKMMACVNWSSWETFTTLYDNWMKWDLSIEDFEPADHAFYFTMRDAYNFGVAEHFGLIGRCNETQCKL